LKKHPFTAPNFREILELFFEEVAQMVEYAFGVGADVNAGVESVFVDKDNAGAEHYGYVVVEVNHSVDAVHIDAVEGRLVVHIVEHDVVAVEIHGRGVESVVGQ
jgi:hypothetical protein